MHAIDEELQHLEVVCNRLEIGLEKQYQRLKLGLFPDAADDGETARLAEHLRSAEDQFARLLRSRDDDSMLPAPEGSQTAARAPRMRMHALQLLALIERNAALCHELQRVSRDALRELQAGGQFLQSVRDCRENRPRYLDARQ